MHIGKSVSVLLVIWAQCSLCDKWDDREIMRFVDSILPTIQLSLRRSEDNENFKTFRRIYRNNKQYDIHILKLKTVNGLKRHNVIIKEKSDDTPLIYIINPVETKAPNAYLTVSESKDLLQKRIQKQRNEMYKRVGTPSVTYWPKPKPILEAIDYTIHQYFDRLQHHNTDKHRFTTKVARTKHNIKDQIQNLTSKKQLRNKVKTNRTHFRSNGSIKTSANKKIHLRNNGTFKINRNKNIFLRKNRTITPKRNKRISLRSNKTIKAKINKKLLRKLATKPQVPVRSNESFNHHGDFSNGPLEISIAQEISTKSLTINKSKESFNEMVIIKKATADMFVSRTEVPTTKDQIDEETTTEEATLKITNFTSTQDSTKKDINAYYPDVDTKKLMSNEPTKIEEITTELENTETLSTEGSSNQGNVILKKESSEITETPTAEELTTNEPTTDNVNKEQKTDVDLTTEKENTENNTGVDLTTDIVNTENNTGVDLTTDKINIEDNIEDTTVGRFRPYRTKGKIISTTAVRTTRSRLSRPLVYMGEDMPY